MKALSSLAEEEQHLTSGNVAEATQLLKAVYGETEDVSIAKMRAQMLLNSKSTLLRILPPTKSAFEEQLKHAAYATVVRLRITF